MKQVISKNDIKEIIRCMDEKYVCIIFETGIPFVTLNEKRRKVWIPTSKRGGLFFIFEPQRNVFSFKLFDSKMTEIWNYELSKSSSSNETSSSLLLDTPKLLKGRNNILVIEKGCVYAIEFSPFFNANEYAKLMSSVFREDIDPKTVRFLRSSFEEEEIEGVSSSVLQPSDYEKKELSSPKIVKKKMTKKRTRRNIGNNNNNNWNMKKRKSTSRKNHGKSFGVKVKSGGSNSPNVKKNLGNCVALFDFIAKRSSELSVEEGDVVKVHEINEREGYIIGEIVNPHSFANSPESKRRVNEGQKNNRRKGKIPQHYTDYYVKDYMETVRKKEDMVEVMNRFQEYRRLMEKRFKETARNMKIRERDLDNRETLMKDEFKLMTDDFDAEKESWINERSVEIKEEKDSNLKYFNEKKTQFQKFENKKRKYFKNMEEKMKGKSEELEKNNKQYIDRLVRLENRESKVGRRAKKVLKREKQLSIGIEQVERRRILNSTKEEELHELKEKLRKYNPKNRRNKGKNLFADLLLKEEEIKKLKVKLTNAKNRKEKERNEKESMKIMETKEEVENIQSRREKLSGEFGNLKKEVKKRIDEEKLVLLRDFFVKVSEYFKKKEEEQKAEFLKRSESVESLKKTKFEELKKSLQLQFNKKEIELKENQLKKQTQLSEMDEELKKIKQSLLDKKNSMNLMERDLRDREDKLKNDQQMLSGEIEERSKLLEEKSREYEMMKEKLEKREELIKNLEEKAKQREEDIKEKTSILEQKESELKNLDELKLSVENKKVSEFLDQKNDLARLEREVKKKKAEVEELGEELKKKETSIQERERGLESKYNKYEKTKFELDSKKDLVNKRKEEIDKRERAIVAKEKEIVEKEGILKSKDEDMIEKLRKLEDDRNELVEERNSFNFESTNKTDELEKEGKEISKSNEMIELVKTQLRKDSQKNEKFQKILEKRDVELKEKKLKLDEREKMIMEMELKLGEREKNVKSKSVAKDVNGKVAKNLFQSSNEKSKPRALSMSNLKNKKTRKFPNLKIKTHESVKLDSSDERSPKRVNEIKFPVRKRRMSKESPGRLESPTKQDIKKSLVENVKKRLQGKRGRMKRCQSLSSLKFGFIVGRYNKLVNHTEMKRQKSVQFEEMKKSREQYYKDNPRDPSKLKEKLKRVPKIPIPLPKPNRGRMCLTPVFRPPPIPSKSTRLHTDQLAEELFTKEMKEEQMKKFREFSLNFSKRSIRPKFSEGKETSGSESENEVEGEKN